MQSKTNAKKLHVQKYPSYLCFEHCRLDHIPNQKNDAKKVFETLKGFASHDQLQLRHIHKLDNGGKNNSVKTIQDTHIESIWSVDVGTRNGKSGNYRLLYYTDPVNSALAKVVAVFIDTH